MDEYRKGRKVLRMGSGSIAWKVFEGEKFPREYNGKSLALARLYWYEDSDDYGGEIILSDADGNRTVHVFEWPADHYWGPTIEDNPIHIFDCPCNLHGCTNGMPF